MVVIEHDIQIDRPIAAVFNYVADARNDPDWCPPVLKVKQEVGDGPEKGASYHVTAKPGPKKVDGPCQIVEFKPPEFVKYEGHNQALKYVYHYSLSPKDGATHLTMITELRTRGIWKLLEPIIKSSSQKVAVEELNRLKEILEQDNA